jgi:hypothetical protein
MKHYVGAIHQSRAPMEYNSNMYKHLHIPMVNVILNQQQKKLFDHIEKYNQRLEALRNNALEIDGCDCSTRKNIALDKVCKNKYFSK